MRIWRNNDLRDPHGMGGHEEYLLLYGEYVELGTIPVGYSRMPDA